MLCLLLMAFAAVRIAAVNFTMPISPAPQPGSTYDITWAPTSPGRVTILINAFDPSNPTLDIITTSATLATVPNSGSYTWNVPSTLCGRFSFSLEFQFEFPVAFSHIWTGTACGASTPVTVAPTTACISTSTAQPSANNQNAFIIPNANNYPFRAGQATYISWKPKTSGSVSLILSQKGNSKTTTIADEISNSGYFAWTPDSSLINFETLNDEATTIPYTLSLESTSSTITSSSLYVLSDSAPTVFVNVSSWQYPTTGQSTTFQWSPSNASSISIQLAFGAGAVPGPTNTILIASKITNTGSYTWNVPSSFTPGQYIVSGLNGDTGAAETTLVSIVVGTKPPAYCGSGVSISSPVTSLVTSSTQITSSSSSLTPSKTVSSADLKTSSTVTEPLSSLAQILHLTSCGSAITPSYTSFISSGRTTSFQALGCPITTSTGPVSSSRSTSAPSCYSGYATFSVASSSSVCCPSAWGTSSMGGMWCYTTTAPTTSNTIASAAIAQKRDISGTQSATASATIYLDNLVFAKAGVVAKDSGKGTSDSSAMSLGKIGATWVFLWGGIILLENRFMW